MSRSLNEVGEAVRRRRKTLRKSVKELAARGGISHTTWYAVENGEQVSDDTYLGVCRALNWTDDSIDLLLDDSPPAVTDRSAEWVTAPSHEVELLAAVRELTDVVRELRADLREGRQ